MVEHCAHARKVWNVALEQANYYRPHWGPTPGHAQRNRQLTEARAAFDWLAAGSVTVQQQALRDFDQAMRNFFAGTHRRPTWRKAGIHEGFRQVAVQPSHIRRLNRRWATVWVPKAGAVRFRWTRQVRSDVKSYRVTLDASGRWHVAFANVPEQIEGPDTGEIVGVDRGVVIPFACSDGTGYALAAPVDTRRAARKVSSAKHWSNGRRRAKRRLARLRAREADRRRDAVEKATTDLARRFDIVRVEDLRIGNMVRSAKGTIDAPGSNVRQKAGLNRSILASGWGLFARRLNDKIGDRLELVPAAYTSQRCSHCGEVDRDSRESQAKFRCTTCGFSCNADLNAAKNIAAGHAVTARGGMVQSGLPVNLEPQLRLVS